MKNIHNHSTATSGTHSISQNTHQPVRKLELQYCLGSIGMRVARYAVCILFLVLAAFIPSVSAVGTLNSYKLINGNYVSGSAPDPNLPSIVITHGWQPSLGGAYADLEYQEDRSGFLDYLANGLNGPDDSFRLKDVVDAVNSRAVQDSLSVNVFHYSWREAYGPNIIDILGNQVFNAGQDLASQLHGKLEPQGSPEYNQQIHFVGHSAGALVSASAIHELSVTEYCAATDSVNCSRWPCGWNYVSF